MTRYSRRALAGALVAILILSFTGIELEERYSPSGASGQVVGADGLRLSVSINSTRIAPGQSVSVDVSLFNTLSAVNTVPASNDWSFEGVPLALWPSCVTTVASASEDDFVTPAEAVVVQGDYTVQNISAVADIHFPFSCSEYTKLNDVVFQPRSSEANLTGVTIYAYDNNETSGPFQASASFVTSGYWNLPSNSERLPPPLINNQNPNLPPTTTAFVPGEYTVAISDEWGQNVILHFVVSE